MATAQLTRWDPFQQLAEMQRDFDRILGRTPPNGEKTHPWVPVVDIEQTKDALVLKFDLPGMKREDVSIEVEGRTLTVSGERKEEKEDKHEGYYSRERLVGRFSRSFMLPEHIDESKIEAKFSDGVLTIRVPRPQEEKPKKIAIKASA
ncbi:MAG: Hsp20/alpha crystallin family protein [Gaiellales bacterium]